MNLPLRKTKCSTCPEHWCRGARDVQLSIMAAAGVVRTQANNKKAEVLLTNRSRTEGGQLF